MKTKNISLRALEPSDIDLLYEWENNPELWHLSDTLVPLSRFDLEQYVLSAKKDIYAHKQVRFMIDIIKEKSTIGNIDLFDFHPANRHAGIGIFIIAEQRNRGFGTEALELIIEYGFNRLNLHQIFCNISEDNQGSIKLFLKLGFKIAGEKKEWILKDNKWLTEYFLQLIN